MIQKINSTQNNMTFGKLIPIKEYQGAPKLSQKAIDGIKAIKQLLVRNEGDIIALEGKMNTERLRGFDAECMRAKIGVLKSHNENLEKAINKIKETKEYKDKLISLLEAKKDNLLHMIEDFYVSFK